MVLAEDLRQAVLQAALQGKLTEQLETDSNVDELLVNIRAEKEKLIAEKKIKKEKLLPEIQEEDIPDNWKWVRLGDILRVSSGDGLTSKNMMEGTIPVYGGNGINGYHDKSNVNKITLTIGRVGANCGTVHITEEKAWVTDNAFIVSFFMKQINIYYWAIVLRTLDLGNKSKATAQPVISGKTIYPVFAPFPPIEEQQRIVDKINEIMPKIDEYEKIEKELEALKKEFPMNMKDALLQAAMQGKLTEQLESDSSVDELLASIKKEKEELIAQKIIKKEKPLSAIEEEEIPFDIPENWKWVRMGSIIKLTSGQDLQPDKYSDNHIGIPYLTGASNFHNGDLVINRYTSSGTSMAYNGDLLLTCKGTIGEMAFMNIEKAHIARQIMSISKIDNINLRYIKLCLENFILKLKANARSIIPGIDRKVILSLPIPLPPIEEQQRIVERLDALLPLCEDLKKE